MAVIALAGRTGPLSRPTSVANIASPPLLPATRNAGWRAVRNDVPVSPGVPVPAAAAAHRWCRSTETVRSRLSAPVRNDSADQADDGAPCAAAAGLVPASPGLPVPVCQSRSASAAAAIQWAGVEIPPGAGQLIELL